MILLDADVLIDVTRRFPPAVAWLTTISSQPIAVPGYAAMELVSGCKSAAEQEVVARITADFEIVWPSPAHCEIALHHFTTLRLAHGIGILDTLIAQTAVELAVPLQTYNVKHMSIVPGLRVQQPYSRQNP